MMVLTGDGFSFLGLAFLTSCCHMAHHSYLSICAVARRFFAAPRFKVTGCFMLPNGALILFHEQIFHFIWCHTAHRCLFKASPPEECAATKAHWSDPGAIMAPSKIYSLAMRGDAASRRVIIYSLVMWGDAAYGA